MLGFDIRSPFKVRDGAADFQDSIIGSGGEAKFGDGHFQQFFAFAVYPAIVSNLTGTHVGVAVQVLPVSEPVVLEVAGSVDARPDGFGGFAGRFAGEFSVVHGGNFNVDVDAVHERS